MRRVSVNRTDEATHGVQKLCFCGENRVGVYPEPLEGHSSENINLILFKYLHDHKVTGVLYLVSIASYELLKNVGARHTSPLLNREMNHPVS